MFSVQEQFHDKQCKARHFRISLATLARWRYHWIVRLNTLVSRFWLIFNGMILQPFPTYSEVS